MITIRQIAFSTLLSAAALQAGAWTLFGSKEDALADTLRAGDKFMQKAEAAFEDGKMPRASKYYERAIQKYEQLRDADPTYMDGLPAIRLSYCAKQYTNALEAASAALAAEEEGTGKREEETGAAEGGASDAAEAVDADENKVAAAGTGKAKDADEDKVAAADTGKAEDADEDEAEAADEAEVAKRQAAQAAPPPKPPYDPRNFPHDFAEARMQIEDGNYSEAAAVLIPMLRHDPSNRQVRLLIAIVRTRQGRYDEAIVALEDLRGIREDLPILLALSGAYMGAARYHDALLALDSAIRLNPADPNAFLNLAWLTLVMPSEPDTLKNAEIYYRQAIRRGAARDRSLEARIGLRKW